jgi:predicted GNAT family N-acyltransferase
MNNFDFHISTDKSRLSIESLRLLMKQTYWAEDRTDETILRSVENSICYGIYQSNKLVGFGRVVTDYATVYWICDIIIDTNYRGNGLGKRLMECIMATKEIEGLQGILATKDAHGLYEQYGFVREPEKFMIKKRTRF